MNEMVGLIRKDWALMARQCKFLIGYIVIFVGILSFTMSDSSFMSSFLSVVMFLLAINCFAYDELVHFDRLLAASPVSPVKVVLARYIAALAVGVIGGVLIALVGQIVLLVRHTSEASMESLFAVAAGLGVAVLLLSVLFPLIYKFGVNKSRILIFIIAGAPTMAVLLLSSILPQDTFRFLILSPAKLRLLPFVAPVILAIVLTASIALSIHVVRHKEY